MTTLWSSSIELMLLGMGTVYVFLGVLVVGMMIMSSIIGRISTPEIAKPSLTSTSSSESDVAAAAAVAWAFAQKASKKP